MVTRSNSILKTTLILAAFLLLAAGASIATPAFDPAVDYAAGDTPSSVFSIDLDGDGD